MLYKETRSSYKTKLESFKLPRSVFSRLEIFMVIMEVLVLSIFLEDLLTLSNVYICMKDKIFQIIESRKPSGNVDNPFALKRLFSSINIVDKFLV